MIRRHFLSLGAAAGAGLVSACIERTDDPQYRSLEIADVEITETATQGTTLSIRTRNLGQHGSDEWQTFHDVRLVGYATDGELVCEKNLGDVRPTPDSVSDAVTLQCETRPDIITFDAAETPCDENTDIQVAFYRGREDEEHQWEYGNRECGDGLPPEWDSPSELKAGPL